MPIKDLTTRKFLAKNFRMASSSFEKTLGLMFSHAKDALVLVFDEEQKISLHMCFVLAAIDVLFLNKEFEVVEMKQDFQPFTFYTSKKKAMYVIELPAGTVKKSRTRPGNKIQLVSVTVEKSKGVRSIRVK